MQIVEHSIIGTRSAILRLHRRGSAIAFVVFPMYHVAAPEFFREVAKRLKQCDLLVVEGVGVKDRSAGSVLTIAVTMTYRVMPLFRRRRLVVDPIPYKALGVPLINPDVTGAEMGRAFGRTSLKFRMFLLLTLPIAIVVNLIGGHRHLLSTEAEVSDVPTEQEEAFADSDFGGDFERLTGGERDDRLVRALETLVRERGQEQLTVGVVYGAGHTAKIVDALHRLGFRLRPSDWITLMAA